MSSNICGNCQNFKPKQGEKFFDCTLAKQGGVSYAMQVRPDTRSCEAFASLKPSPKPQAAVKPAAPPPKRVEPRGQLCNWGRAILMAALIITILLIAFGAYTCFKGGSPATTPTPTPTPTTTSPVGPTATIIVVTPKPTPTPFPIYEYTVGDWVAVSPYLINVDSPQRVRQYVGPGPISAPGSP